MSTLTQEGIIEQQHAPLLAESSPISPPTMNVVAPPSVAPAVNAQPNAKKGDSKLYSRRLLIHTNASGTELAAGKVLKIPDAENLFKPDFSTANESDLKELKSCDLTWYCKQSRIMSCFSSCDAPVIMGLKLFTHNDSSKSASYEDLKISNENGWLYSCASNSLGNVSSKGSKE